MRGAALTDTVLIRPAPASSGETDDFGDPIPATPAPPPAPLLDAFDRPDEGPPLAAPYDSGGYDGFRVLDGELRAAEGASEDFTGKLDAPITCMSVDIVGMPDVHGGPAGLTVSPVSADVWGYYFTAGFSMDEDGGDWGWTIAHVPSSEVVLEPGPAPVAGDKIGCDYDGAVLRALHFTGGEWHVRATMAKVQPGLFYPGIYGFSYSALHSVSDYRLDNLRGGPGLLETEPADTAIEVPAMVSPLDATEDEINRDVRLNRYEVTLELDAPIDGLSELEWRGKLYRVIGEPRLYSSTHRGGGDHYELEIRREEG